MDRYDRTADTAFLANELGRKLYQKTTDARPAVLFSDTLTADDILDDLHAATITEFLNLSAPDRARLLRAAGVAEDFITGAASDFEKFSVFAAAMPQCAGHPIYTECHYLLRRVFGCTLPLNAENAEKIWCLTAEKLSLPDFGLRGLLSRTGATLLLSAAPHAPLSAFQALKNEGFSIPVLPVFAPSEVTDLRAMAFSENLHRLEASTHIRITNLSSFQEALLSSLDRFAGAGCSVAFHTLPSYFSFERPDPYHANDIFCRARGGEPITHAEASLFLVQELRFLGEAYKARGIKMILQPPQESAPVARTERCAPNRGLALTALLTYLEEAGKLPHTVLAADRDLGVLTDALYSVPRRHEKICKFTGEGASTALLQRDAPRFGLCYPSVSSLAPLLSTLAAQLPLGALSFAFLQNEARGATALSALFAPDILHRMLCDLLGTLAERGDAPRDLDTLADLARRILRSTTDLLLS